MDTYRSSTIELIVHDLIEKLLDDGSVRTSDLIEVLLDGEPFDLREGLLLYERDVVGIVLIQRAAIPGEFFAIFIPVCKTLTSRLVRWRTYSLRPNTSPVFSHNLTFLLSLIQTLTSVSVCPLMSNSCIIQFSINRHLSSRL